jgi:hypothetical protein
MHHWAKRLFVVAAPLLLTGCLWGPGNFTSNLTVLKDGSFTLDYKGEIVLAMPPPDEGQVEPWKDSMARCHKSGATEVVSDADTGAVNEDDPVRPCTAAELARLKAQYLRDASQKAADKAKESEQMAKAFGLAGFDDESNRAFAAKLMKYAGWRSVVYRGKGVFDVDYHFEGKATQDFVFPALPDNDLIIPFIAIRRRSDGSVLVTAPALTGGAGPLAGAAAGEAAAASGPSGPPPSRAQGRFTVTTNGEILTNNSEDGPTATPAGKQVHWDVVAASKVIPETLIRLQ